MSFASPSLVRSLARVRPPALRFGVPLALGLGLVLVLHLSRSRPPAPEEPPAPDLATRLARAGPGTPPPLDDLRAAGALAEAPALRLLARLLAPPKLSPRTRQAAFTAYAATLARLGLGVDDAPPPAIDTATIADLASGLEEDPGLWRGRALRGLARRLALSPADLESLRARAREGPRDPSEACDAGRARDVLYLLGDREALDAAREPDDLDRAGLLAPLASLRARVDPDELDRTFTRESWGGRGAWRALEALASWPRGRVALRAALRRAPVPECPAAVAAAVLLARCAGARSPGTRVRTRLEAIATRADASGLASWARAALEPCGLPEGRALDDLARSGELEDLPPPLVEAAVQRLGAAAGEALLRAAGEPSGRLRRVLEPGAGSERARFLTDLALAAFSTPGAQER